MKETFTTSDGIRLAYYIDDFTDPWRSAPTLVMLHSAMSSAKRFYSMVPGLARHCRVIRLDSRGLGESEVPPAHVPHSRERLNQDVLELLDRLGIASAHVLDGSAGDVGLTFGAWHGDWAPWKMRPLAGRLLVWDWERFTIGGPLGYDALHFDLQQRISSQPAYAISAPDPADLGRAFRDLAEVAGCATDAW